MEAHLHEEFKLWSFVVLCQSQSRMRGKIEESNMKSKRTETIGHISRTLWSPFYVYYIFFLKLGKSGVQHFKRCMNRSWNEEVMAIWRQSHQAKRKFRNCEISLRKFRSYEINLQKFCKVFRSCETTCKHMCATSQFKFHFRTMRITLRNGHFQLAKSTYVILDIFDRLN